MADYKIVDAEMLDAQLNALAESIRLKSGISGDLAFPSPNEFKEAVDSINAVKNETKPETITSNGNHPTDGYSNVEVNVPTGIAPIGNLTDSLITRSSVAASTHRATIPAGYYVNEDITISDWKSGQINGTGIAGGSFDIPYSNIGFIPKAVAVLCNSANTSTNMVFCAFSWGTDGGIIYRGTSGNGSRASCKATMDSNGVKIPAPNSSIKFINYGYRWYALR